MEKNGAPAKWNAYIVWLLLGKYGFKSIRIYCISTQTFTEKEPATALECKPPLTNMDFTPM